MAEKSLYRIAFVNLGKVYEIYVREIVQSSIFGFVQISDFQFGERSETIVDPAEEKLKAEFSAVKKAHIPMNAIIRIDEVEKQGRCKIKNLDSDQTNIMPFPRQS